MTGNVFQAIIALAVWAAVTPCSPGAVAEPEVPGAAFPGPFPAGGGHVMLVSVNRMSDAERVAVLSVQGLANRAVPQVFVHTHGECHWMEFHYGLPKNPKTGAIWNPAVVPAFQARYPSVEDYWIGIFSKKGYRFEETSLEGLIRHFDRLIKGVILYEKASEDLAAVVSYAGARDAIPLTRELIRTRGLESWVATKNTLDYGAVRKAFPAPVNYRLSAHDWMLENVADACRKDGAVSRIRLYGSVEHDTFSDVDLAVRNRWMVYELNHRSPDTAHDKKAVYDFREIALKDRVLSSLRPWSAVYGWGTDEESFIRSLAPHRLLAVCGGVPNLSFFQSLPDDGRPFVQKRGESPAADVVVEEKIYLTFMVNEGDSVKAMASLMCFGSWIQPERGTVPVNWGFDPLLVQEFPALARFYYSGQTPADYFFSATSGWGYTHVRSWPEADLPAYGDLVSAGSKRAALQYLDVWWPATGERMNAFRQRTRMSGYTNWAGLQKVNFSPDGLTVIDSNNFYTYNNAEAFSKVLLKQAEEVKGPWFNVIYGANEHLTPFKVAELVKLLPADRFKVVLLDEFFAAAKKSQAALRGRQWKPSAADPAGVAP